MGRVHKCVICNPVINLYKNGLSIVAIAAKMAQVKNAYVEPGSIRQILLRHNVVFRDHEKIMKMREQHQRRNEARWQEQAIEMRKEGYSLREIGSKFEVSHERVRQVLAKNGFLIRVSKRHVCTDLCEKILQENQPIKVASLSRKLNVSTGRILTVAKRHNLKTSSGHTRTHICTERCDAIRKGLEENLTFRQIVRKVGFAPTVSLVRFRLHHPDWPWPASEWWKRPGAIGPRRRAIKNE